MRVVLEYFVKEIACWQPHRHSKRLSDTKWLEVILLPMNTRREDVLVMVNFEILRPVATQKVSKAQFDKMWAQEFIHVHIPPNSQFPNVKFVGNSRMSGGPSQPHAQKAIRERYKQHLAICALEKRNYWNGEDKAICQRTS